MSKKLIYLVSFVLVLGLALTSAVEAADPSLVGWWRFDEGSGTIVKDSSGNGNDGTITNATWETGKHGSALGFNGSAYVDLPAEAWSTIERQATFTFWAYGDPAAQPQANFIFGAFQDPAINGSRVMSAHVPWSNGDVYFDTGGTTADGYDRIQKTATAEEYAGSWQHWALVKDADAGEQKIYLNGVLWHSVTGMTKPMTGVTAFTVGAKPSIENYYFGMMDDIRLYNRALSQEEIEQAMIGIPPGVASDPSPADRATDVPREVVLSWTPGEFAAPTNGHKVYLGQSFNDVNDATGGVAQDAASYTPAQRLDFGTTYYWRIDEVNAPPTSQIEFKSEVWSFTTEPIAYAIENITATASSTHLADTGTENTINGSGLDVNDLHSIEPADMWLSGDEPNGAWIEYELDKVYKLHQMWVWNHNGTMESVLGFGFKDVTIEYSTNGTDYTTLGTTHEFARAPGAVDYAHNTTVDFGGVTAKYVRLTTNSNWGAGLLDQYGLSEVRFFSIPVFAREPSPDSGTTDVAVDVTLGFRAGREADKHDVYLSTDEQAVIDGTAPVTTVTENSYSTLLDVDSTYYWRVDEVNDAETTTTWQGDIWNFSTHEFFIVDDFEDYNDWTPDEIWSTWVDGYGVLTNGSTVGYPAPDWNQGEHYVETTFVHGGSQTMPFFYDNTGTAAYSEGERTFAVPQDWTKAGVQTLALYFRGTGGNTGQLYVEVNGSKVVYDGDAADVQRAGWQAWNIELASFGTNLQSVTTLGIGIDGNGASGTLYFDDFRLYARSREFITPVEPNSAGLIGHWKFDGDTLDSSGLGNHGTTYSSPTYAVGMVGQAMSFDGITDFVAIDGVTASITNDDITLAGWVKTADTGSVYWFSCNGPAGGSVGNVALFAILGGQVAMYDINAAEGRSNTLVNDLDWHHLAYSRSGSTGSIYVDGNLENTHTANFTFTDPLNRWSIGQEWDDTTASNFLTGMVDDARIYDYGLSLEEVAWLTGRTEPFDKPF
ncbi:MAG: discoidin domain-containing protein [Planctomycetes bacterium]|nr:discoidin domain-containing protein [Planctomycetota bacterium]